VEFLLNHYEPADKEQQEYYSEWVKEGGDEEILAEELIEGIKDERCGEERFQVEVIKISEEKNKEIAKDLRGQIDNKSELLEEFREAFEGEKTKNGKTTRKNRWRKRSNERNSWRTWRIKKATIFI